MSRLLHWPTFLSLLLLVGLLNDETSTLTYLSKIWVFDVDGSSVSLDESMHFLMSKSVLIISIEPSVSSCSETGLNVGLLLWLASYYTLEVSIPKLEPSSMFLLGLFSSFWVVCKIGRVLMVPSCSGTYRNEHSSSCFYKSRKVFSTSTFVLSLSMRVFSNHSDWLEYLSISSIGWWM